MGIPKFWECIEDAAKEHQFLQLAVEEGFRHGSGECQPLLMGVDASIWMYQADRAVNYGNAKAGPNPQLRVLYYRLVGLLTLPLRVVFVFDGPDRPKFKRDTRVLTYGHWLTEQFCELVGQFGYHCHKAPAEADAELGRLASEGYIDIVQTTDSDIFLFGAATVMKIPQKKADGKNVTIYSPEDLFITPSIGLTRGGILLIALLAGGDYHMGIPGCGIKTAHAIARGNLGDILLQKVLENPIPTPTFLEFLRAWKIALCDEFSTDPHRHLGRKYKAISATIAKTASFPSIDVIFAYVHPITSWSKNLPPDHRSWGLAQPNLAGITRFCQLQFAWDATTIAAKFSKSLYPGIVMQSLLKPYDLLALLAAHVESGVSCDDDFPRSAVLRVLQSQTTTSHNRAFKQYKIEMATGALNLRVKAAINDASAFSAPTLMIKWIPAPIIDYALPDLVSRSNASAKLKAIKSRSPVSRVSKSVTSVRKPRSSTPFPVAGPSRVSVSAQEIIDLTSPEPEGWSVSMG